MDIKCPNCGKHIALTKEELATATCKVVCPQCLEEWVVNDVDLEGIAPRASHVAPPVEAEKTDGFNYCGECGKKLPAQNLNFCPYCGKPLAGTQLPHASMPIPEPVVPPTPNVVQPADKTATATRQPIPTITYFPYNPVFKRKFVEEKPASLPVKIFCYFIIAVLLAVFAFIVYKGLQ